MRLQCSDMASGRQRGLDGEQARMLLRPDKAIITEPHHVWPTLTDEQWIKACLPFREPALRSCV